jgi:hypothetical protein
MLNVFDTLAWKAQYLAGNVKAHLSVGYSGVRNPIFQQLSDALASFLPHESGEEPGLYEKNVSHQRVTRLNCNFSITRGTVSNQIG